MPPGVASTLTRSHSLLHYVSSAARPYPLCHITRSSFHPSLRNPHSPHYSTSTPCLGRGGNSTKNKSHFNDSSSPSASASSSANGPSESPAGASPSFDPLDFSLLNAAHERLITQLRADLWKLKPGGLDPDVVGKVPVKLKDDLQTPPKKAGGRKGEQERARLMSVSVGELAQVVTRGRILVLLVGEKEHIKPVLSALRSSLDLPSAPTSVESPGLHEIHIPIPKTTGESRAQAQLAAKQLGENALRKWNDARSVEQKRLRALELGRNERKMRASEDSIRKAEGRLKKQFDNGIAEVQTLVEGTKKRLSGE